MQRESSDAHGFRELDNHETRRSAVMRESETKQLSVPQM